MNSILTTECASISSKVAKPKKEKKQSEKKTSPTTNKKTTSKPKKEKEMVFVENDVNASLHVEDSNIIIPAEPNNAVSLKTIAPGEIPSDPNIVLLKKDSKTEENKKPRRPYQRKAPLKAELVERMADMERRMDATIYCLDYASNMVRELLLKYTHSEDSYLIRQLTDLTDHLSTADEILNSPLEDEMIIVYHKKEENDSNNDE